MLENLKNLWNKSSEEGINLPYAKDHKTGEPSLTLLMFYLTFVVSMTSLVALHFVPSLVSVTAMAFLSWGMGFVFYRLRHLDKVKIDLDNKAIELSDEEEEKPSND